MRFLVDVNASGVVARWLEERGHDVVEVADTDPGMDDAAILAWAVAEDRAIVTTDQDFEELIWREGKPHKGLLRLENLPRAERVALLADVLEHHQRELQSGAIVIASSRKIRIRKRQIIGRASSFATNPALRETLANYVTRRERELEGRNLYA